MRLIYVISDGRSFRLLVARDNRGNYTGVLEHGDEVEVKSGDLASIIAMIEPFIGNSSKIVISGDAEVKFYRVNDSWLMISRNQLRSLTSLSSRDILTALSG